MSLFLGIVVLDAGADRHRIRWRSPAGFFHPRRLGWNLQADGSLGTDWDISWIWTRDGAGMNLDERAIKKFFTRPLKIDLKDFCRRMLYVTHEPKITFKTADCVKLYRRIASRNSRHAKHMSLTDI